jgi:hypothetical protein
VPRVTSIVTRRTNGITLVQGHEYDVIGIDDAGFDVVDELGEPGWYPKSFFLEQDLRHPEDWQYEDFGDDGYCCFPRELGSRFFFEDYSDRKQSAIEAYKSYIAAKKLGPRQDTSDHE